METTDYVSYPIALALKRAGFDWKCRAHYTNDYVNDAPEDVSSEVKFHYDWTSPYDYNRIVGNTSAPTLWQAQKWLREVKGFHPEPQYYLDNRWICVIKFLSSGGWKTVNNEGQYFPSYEAALSAGIAAALELIEKKGE